MGISIKDDNTIEYDSDKAKPKNGELKMSQYIEVDQFILIDKIYRCHLFLAAFQAAIRAKDEAQIAELADEVAMLIEDTKPIVIKEEPEKDA